MKLLITISIITTSALAQIPKYPLPKCADISINGIYLEDSMSTIKILGRSIMKPKDDFTGTHYYNKSKSEILSIIYHPGDYWYCFSEFKIFISPKNFKDSITTLHNISHFVTGKGVHLGISRDKLIAILGKNYEVLKNSEGEKIIKYSLTDFDNDSFLKFYNTPSYYGEYIFQRNILIKCAFGFEYP